MQTFSRTLGVGLGLALGTTGFTACSSAELNPPEQDAVGTLRAELTLGEAAHDVVSMSYKVVAGGQSCSDAAIAETTTALEAEALPGSVQVSGGGQTHRFGDALFELAPGSYHICVVPLNAMGQPSAECSPAEGDANVVAEQTSEVLLVSQCDGPRNGGLDVVTVLNDPPTLDSLTIDPSKFITTCEDATITVTASDPNGDAVTFSWSIVAGPGGATLATNGSSATFHATAAGDYELRVAVTDVYGGASAQTFPIHVSAADCPNTASCLNNPKWMPVNCVTDQWVWSSDRAHTTLADANAARTLRAGCFHAGAANTCSLDGTGWVSTQEFPMMGCDTSWWHIGGSFTGNCFGHDTVPPTDVVRLLALGVNDCYDY